MSKNHDGLMTLSDPVTSILRKEAEREEMTLTEYIVQILSLWAGVLKGQSELQTPSKEGSE